MNILSESQIDEDAAEVLPTTRSDKKHEPNLLQMVSIDRAHLKTKQRFFRAETAEL